MAGEAKTNAFLLSTATVMIGPRASLMGLTPALHSIGLVKNVQVTSEPSNVALTQGLQNVEVSSVSTGSASRISAEIYEYSARNLAYGAGLDATGTSYDEPVTPQSAQLATAITTGGVSVVLATGDGADFSVGDFAVLQDLSNPDLVHVGKVASKATDTITLVADYTIPTTTQFPIATTVVYKVRNLKIGGVNSIAYFGIKIVGLLPETGEPITALFPKCRVSKGIGLAFQSDNFSNIPFEFSPMAVLPGDPFFSEYGSQKTWSVLKR